MRGMKIATVILMLSCAAPAVACDQDGYGGHRFFAFGMKAGAPQQQLHQNDILSRLEAMSEAPPVNAEPIKLAVITPSVPVPKQMTSVTKPLAKTTVVETKNTN